MKQKTQFRQGDVLIERVKNVPANLIRQKGPPILAHGEVTGHAHAIEDLDVKVWVPEGAGENVDATLKFAEITKPTRVVHQEHAPIDLEPGIYKVVRQREYSPAEIHRVQD